MHFDDLIDRPDAATLTDVVSGRRLDLIAPFSRRFALDRLRPGDHDTVRIITRLPPPGVPIPRLLDNDPGDFVRLLERMGQRVRVFGLPAVHTKLYLNGTAAYFGSANFTGGGFGRRPEALLVTTDQATYAHLAALFDEYLQESVRLPLGHLRALRQSLERGRTALIAAPEQPVTLRRNRRGDDEADFRNWLPLGRDGDADYIEARFDPGAGYAMTGHTQSAFPGIRAFLRDNLDLVPSLAAASYVKRLFWQERPELVQRFRRFVEVEGHRFPARGGGAWEHKLPEFLGGTPGGGPRRGGRGSGLIARMLIFLARYAIDKGF
jgi:hypothetical protein